MLWAGATTHWHITLPDFGGAERLRVAGVEFGFGAAQTPKGDFVVFDDQFATVTADLVAIGARRITGGGNKHTRGTIGAFHVGGDVVFDFDLVVFAEMTKGTYTHRHHP